MALVVAWLVPVAVCAAGGPVVWYDHPRDAVIRRTDPGGTAPFNPHLHRLPDIQRISLGAWQPDDPQEDLYTGDFDGEGGFFRLDMVLAGLINPPGSIQPATFNPYAYGDHPVFGFIEIDMDGDVDTGGETHAPQFRYLGSAARFGGLPPGTPLAGRAAPNASAFDGQFTTPPHVERSGEEFHLALMGSEFSPLGITVIEGNGNLLFEAGETWDLRGRFFHRAHGFEPFSFIDGGAVPGEYAPLHDLRFRHEPAGDFTTITLVFPLTHEAAAEMHGEPVQPINQDPTDHASVEEALADLQLSAFFLQLFPTGLPEEVLIQGWGNRHPPDHLDPTAWRVTALVGTSYASPLPGGVQLIWTDIFPGPLRGDVDGNAHRDGRDRQLIAQYISTHDASDGQIDGQVVIPGFPADFSVYDVNHDGVVNAFDVAMLDVTGDVNADDAVDLADFAWLQNCYHRSGPPFAPCGAVDFNGNNFIGPSDVRAFIEGMSGPYSFPVP